MARLPAQLRTTTYAPCSFGGRIPSTNPPPVAHNLPHSARVVATELRQLVERLMGVAYMPGTEIERLVEEQAFELNTVIVLNRKVRRRVLPPPPIYLSPHANHHSL